MQLTMVKIRHRAHPTMGRHAPCLLLALALAVTMHAQEAPSLLSLEQQAMQAAVERVAPSVVRIEAIGGLERAGNVLLGDGPTTGVVVSSDGYIVSSAFNFAQKPASILVTLPDGTRTPATWVAADKSRMLVLLKVSTMAELPVPAPAPVDELRVGQWAIAVGKTYEGPTPPFSYGIISALDRIWGKAVQTDANVSPGNYGGPLVDVQGRVIGVLVPFSPDSSGEAAGVEWYDSGIGFAVPFEHVLSVLPRLREGSDLVPGVLGISLKGRDLYGEAPTIGVCRSDSPAYKAGLRVGDRIVAVDGEKVDNQAQVKHLISPRYAGETIRVAVARGEAEIERSIELIAKLLPYRHAFLGILPRRDEREPGVRVRYVYRDSPAAKAGIQPGDRIVSLDALAAANAEELRERLSGLGPEQQVRIEVRRNEETLYPEVTLAALPLEVPAELPPAALPGEATAAEDRPAVGQFKVGLPEYPNECLAYVPADYDRSRAYGLVVWLHPAGGDDDAQLLARWTAACDRDGLILLAPRAANKERWDPDEAQFVRRAIEHVQQRYSIDKTRVVACGAGAGSAMAYLLGFQHRDLVRGVAALDGPFAGRPPENDPAERLAFYVATAKESPHFARTATAVAALSELNYPVTVRDLGAAPRELNESELAELQLWIDTLDRL